VSRLFLNLAAPILTLEQAVEAVVQAVDLSTAGSGSTADQYGAEVAWGLIHGQLRGRIPYPVPYDLMAVAVSVAIRWTTYLGNSEQLKIAGDAITGFQPPIFTGFTLTELIVLWRCRIRTA
jgi:hypothetical protein